MRWPIEQWFQDGKSHLGMGDYEHRSWPAWHRHMTYVILGLHFLLRLRLDNKKSPTLTLPQAQQLIATVLPLASINTKEALAIVHYHTQRFFWRISPIKSGILSKRGAITKCVAVVLGVSTIDNAMKIC